MGRSATAESHFYFLGNWGRWLFPISSHFDRLITSWKGKKKGKRKEEELDQKIPPPPPLWFQQGEKEQSTTSISPALLARFSKRGFPAFCPIFARNSVLFFSNSETNPTPMVFFLSVVVVVWLFIYIQGGQCFMFYCVWNGRKKGKESQLRWFIPSFMAFPPLSLHPPFSREKERRREACHYWKYLRQKIKINTAIS